jgi:hypothetical protein
LTNLVFFEKHFRKKNKVFGNLQDERLRGLYNVSERKLIVLMYAFQKVRLLKNFSIILI